MKKHNESSIQFKLFNNDRDKNDFISICQKFITAASYLTPDKFRDALIKWREENNIAFKTLSLFSGAGGLDIGFEDVGFNIIESVEVEPKFAATATNNKKKNGFFHKTNIICKDIREYSPDPNLKVDFIIGGPPCQSFSSAGRRVAGVRGLNDDRGSLFEEYVRILKILQPKGFLFENVYGILGAQKGNAIKQIVAAFKDAGYTLSYKVLDAADYGTPQHRERLILVGLKDGTFRFPRPTHGNDAQNTPFFSASEALENVPNKNKASLIINGRFGHLLNEIPPGLNYSFFTEKMGHPNPIFAWRSKFSDFLYKADPETPVRTIKASGGQYTGPFHWENRRFTIDELKRLQTFPDSYEFGDNYGIALKQIGNSVPPQFARVLALSILDQVFGFQLPFSLKYMNENEEPSFRKNKRLKQDIYYKKAQVSISAITTQTIHLNEEYSYSGFLTSNFELVKSTQENHNSNYKIHIDISTEKWRVYLENKIYDSIDKIKIGVFSTKHNNIKLFNDVSSIELYSNSLDIIDHTALWKAFEKALIEHGKKADLVQFNGYYQYKNDIKYSLSFFDSISNNNNLWRVVDSIYSNDAIIGKIKPIDYYLHTFNLELNELITIFKNLRAVGYEIRNHNTNSEIEKNHYLIPYKFPTLTPLSVQLNKSL